LSETLKLYLQDQKEEELPILLCGSKVVKLVEGILRNIPQAVKNADYYTQLLYLGLEWF